jgi:hypothetical protein
MSSKKSTKPQPNAKTIDEKHTDMLNQFHEIETTTIPKLKEEYRKWKHKFATLPENKVDARMEIQDKLKTIKSKIQKLKSQRNEYLLDNSKYIFHYFEDKKKISSGDNNQNANAVNSFFRIKATTEEASDPANTKYNQAKIYYQKYF